MSELVFDCLDVRAEPYAAAPTLAFRLRIAEVAGEPIHAIALRVQIRIDPLGRRYSDVEAGRLLDLFGEASRWSETMRPLHFTIESVMVPAFTGSTEVDVHVACTYDFEVASSKYFNALDDGEVPLTLLFSGTVFRKAPTGFSVEQIPWHKEAAIRLPVKVWHEMLDLYFPNSGWIRMRRDTIDELSAFKASRALLTWDDTMEALLGAAREAAR